MVGGWVAALSAAVLGTAWLLSEPGAYFPAAITAPAPGLPSPTPSALITLGRPWPLSLVLLAVVAVIGLVFWPWRANYIRTRTGRRPRK